MKGRKEREAGREDKEPGTCWGPGTLSPTAVEVLTAQHRASRGRLEQGVPGGRAHCDHGLTMGRQGQFRKASLQHTASLQLLQGLWLQGQFWSGAGTAGRHGDTDQTYTGQEARPRAGTPREKGQLSFPEDSATLIHGAFTQRPITVNLRFPQIHTSNRAHAFLFLFPGLGRWVCVQVRETTTREQTTTREPSVHRGWLNTTMQKRMAKPVG